MAHGGPAPTPRSTWPRTTPSNLRPKPARNREEGPQVARPPPNLRPKPAENREEGPQVARPPPNLRPQPAENREEGPQVETPSRTTRVGVGYRGQGRTSGNRKRTV